MRAARRAILVAVAVLAALLPAVAVAGPADAAGARWYCGRQCNGHAPSWAIPSNGVQCSRTGKRIAWGHPTGDPHNGGRNDPYMTVNVYYSANCQTLWATATNSRATGRAICDIRLEHYSQYSWLHQYGCPAAGHSVTTPMVDDHDPHGDLAADVYLYEFWNGPGGVNGTVAEYTFNY